MGVDLRQVVAGILTLTMFVMLGNMIKRDHFDSVEVRVVCLFVCLLVFVYSYICNHLFSSFSLFISAVYLNGCLAQLQIFKTLFTLHSNSPLCILFLLKLQPLRRLHKCSCSMVGNEIYTFLFQTLWFCGAHSSISLFPKVFGCCFV